MDPEPLNREQCKGHAVVPYIQGISEKIKRVLQKHNMKVMEKPIKKLRRHDIEMTRVFTDTTSRTRQIHNKNLEVLKREHASTTDLPSIDRSKLVVNLSSRTLTSQEVSILQKGLNFCLKPNTF